MYFLGGVEACYSGLTGIGGGLVFAMYLPGKAYLYIKTEYKPDASLPVYRRTVYEKGWILEMVSAPISMISMTAGSGDR